MSSDVKRITMGHSFSEKVALITGSNSGVGEKIALYLATLGFKLVITGRDEQRIRNVVENCKKLSKQKVIGVKTDLLKDNEIKSLVQTTITEFQRIDLLINGANITIRCSITDPNIMESYDKVINTNVRSVLLLTSLVVPHLQTSKGSIINLISDSGLKPYESEFLFGISEAAMDMFTRTLALELKTKGIRVLTANSSLILLPSFEKNPWFATIMYSKL